MQSETAAALPRWPTSFVGRAGELAELRRLVAGSRLVTVTGPGGVGKTRLAANASAGLADRFPAGVLFVDLATVSGKEQVESALAGVLAAGGMGGRPPLNGIVERLGGASILLRGGKASSSPRPRRSGLPADRGPADPSRVACPHASRRWRSWWQTG